MVSSICCEMNSAASQLVANAADLARIIRLCLLVLPRLLPLQDDLEASGPLDGLAPLPGQLMAFVPAKTRWSLGHRDREHHGGCVGARGVHALSRGRGRRPSTPS